MTIVSSQYYYGNQLDNVVLQVKSVYIGSYSIRFFWRIIWNLIPNETKNSDSLDDFFMEKYAVETQYLHL